MEHPIHLAQNREVEGLALLTGIVLLFLVLFSTMF
jgi:hypothetical protein